MTDSVNEDSVTKLNTQLNKSMILMENAVENAVENTLSPNHKCKSITINTKVQPPKTPVKSRKSILKRSSKSGDNLTNDEVARLNSDAGGLNEGSSSPASVLSRPHTLEDIVQKETLVEKNTSSTFNLEDLSDSEEFWIMDIPRLIDPQELHGQTIAFESKSKFRIKDERYCIIAHNTSHNVTCVFNSKKDTSRYKTVNVKPAGLVTVRRKLSRVPEVKPVSMENTSVQFPDNLRTRHPLIGVIRERKRRSKKHNSHKPYEKL